MLKSIKFRPVVSGILACILFGLLLQGCSTKGSFLGFLKFWRSGDAEYAAQREKASTLMSSVRRQPGNPDSHYLLATYYQKQGYHHQAIDEFKKTVQIDPRNAAAYSALGVSYDCLGAFEDPEDHTLRRWILSPPLTTCTTTLATRIFCRASTSRPSKT